MQNKIIFIDKTGRELKCEIVALFKNGETNYVAYTDNNKTDGLLDLMVAKYKTEGNKNILIPIEDDKEFEFAEKYLAQELFKGDE